DLLALLAEALDPHRDDIAGLQPFLLALHAVRDAGRRAGGDEIAGLEDKELRAVPDEMLGAEDHGLGGAALALLAVHVRPHLEVLDVLDLVARDHPRT